MKKWYSMPTFKEWISEGFYIPALISFLIKKPLLKICFWRKPMKYLYFGCFVLSLLLGNVILEIQRINENTSIDYYNCELNELTHRWGDYYMWCSGREDGSDIIFPEPDKIAIADYKMCSKNKKYDCYKLLLKSLR